MENQIVLEEYKGMICRPNTSDKQMVKESILNYKAFNFDSNSVVVDFGANIGAFGKMALDAGCKEIHSYEPDFHNFEILKSNLESYNIKENIRSYFYNAAVSLSSEPELILYQNDSNNMYCSGTVAPASNRSKASRKNRTIVKNIQINEVFEQFKPTHFKMDIEGAEIDWIKNIKGKIPDCVQEFAVEIHKDASNFYEEFDSTWFPIICSEFDCVYIHPNSGFKSEKLTDLPNLEIKVYGALFGIDLLFKRRI